MSISPPFEALAQCPAVLRSSVDEPFLVDRCLAAVVGRDRKARRSTTPPPTPGTSTIARTQSFLPFSSSMSRMAFLNCDCLGRRRCITRTVSRRSACGAGRADWMSRWRRSAPFGIAVLESGLGHIGCHGETALIVAVTAADPLVSVHRQRFDVTAGWGGPGALTGFYP